MTPRAAKSSKRSPSKRSPSKRSPSKGSASKRSASKGTPSKRSASKGTPSKQSPSKRSTGKRTSHKATPSQSILPGTERARDEQRSEHGPQYGGGPWKLADQRGDNRFGKARNDDADLAELAPRDASNDDDDALSAADPELAAAEAAGEIEGSGQHAGMGRGEEPRKLKSRR